MLSKKSLVLGAFAVVAGAAGAQAADLPVKAKSVQYVKICTTYGAGFYYILGTDTCLKVGGYVRADYYMNSVQGSGFTTLGTYNRASTYYSTRARAAITLDARTQTAYGTLRSYAQFGINSDQAGAAAGTARGSGAYIQFAFIQFAGFTFGNAQSFFDIYGWDQVHLNHRSWTNGSTGSFGVNLAAYTAKFGSGVTASLSLEDPSVRRPGVFGWNAPGVLTGVNATKGVNFPDLIANVRVEQNWGFVQVSGALHDASGTWYGPGGTGAGAFSPLNRSTGDELGWAIAGGGLFKIPGTAGDTFGIQATYSKGAAGYATSLGGYSIVRDSVQTFGLTNDAVFANAAVAGTGIVAGQTELTEVWGVELGYEHVWMPGLKSSIAGGYNKVNFNSNAAAIICSAAFAAAGCNPDHAYYQIGSRTVWSPVANLDIALDVVYSHFDGMSYSPNFVGGAGAAATPAGLGSADIWSGMARVQRSFWK